MTGVLTPPIHTTSALYPPTSLIGNQFGLLVLEVAARVEPLSNILARHNLTKKAFLHICNNPQFAKAVAEQRQSFASFRSIGERVRVKAQILTERLLDDMYTIATHPTTPPQARVAAFDKIKSLTGLERPEQAEPPQKFSLTINLDKQDITVHNEQPALPSPNGQHPRSVPYPASTLTTPDDTGAVNPFDDTTQSIQHEMLYEAEAIDEILDPQAVPDKPWKGWRG